MYHFPRAVQACLLLLVLITAQFSAAQTQNRVLMRNTLGLTGILNVCNLLGCSSVQAIGDPSGQLFMVQTSSVVDSLLLLVLRPLGVVSVESDQLVATQGATVTSIPPYLNDRTPITYYGATVWRGYVYQPANQLIQTDSMHSIFGVAGSGITVAVIDTGVDPNHPALKSSLVTGYDFTRNQSGGSEMADVSQSTAAVLDSSGMQAAQVSQSTAAVLDQSTAAVLDGHQYQAFGHGTMVSGIVHLVAPQAKIMPLKSFHADGSGYNSDILRAIYYAASHGAKVINMSFNYTTYSQELANAVNYVTANGVICIAAAGNSGRQATVYPAALKGVVDVASTSLNDTPSTFSNYGAPPVWLAAPGEAIMTTYPFGTYAAGWGTSFSAPFVSGTTAVIASVYKAQTSGSVSLLGLITLSTSSSTSLAAGEPQAANALSHAQYISAPQLGYGRLDTYQAVQAFRNYLGLH
ncbi:MAG TPA: S8 family serine peptidase [Terriglobales bacterium]|nr:S8 family serine peptidase [Terriglobales bacterium]